jgi:hypothetical protein
MHRRPVLALLASPLFAGAGLLTPLRARAHHGWSSFDPGKPLYLKGRVKTVRWRNPHAELEVEPASNLSLPPDLAKREPPAQTSSFDGRAILAKTRLVDSGNGSWTVELAPLTRLQAWSVSPIREGQEIEVIGYTLADRSERLMRAEWIILDGRMVGLRSSPA